MGAHLRLTSIEITDPKHHAGYIAVTAATYSDSAGLSVGNSLPPLSFESKKGEPWKWIFEGDGLAIQDYPSAPDACNWVVVVTHSHDAQQGQQIVTAVGGAVSAAAQTAGGKIAKDLGVGLVTAMETAIDSLFFKPKRLGTFIGSASGGELQSSWTRREDRNAQPAIITLSWSVEASAAGAAGAPAAS